MPQIDLTFFPSQIFWLGITFVILYLYIGKVVIPKILRINDRRDMLIDEYANKIEKLKFEVEELKGLVSKEDFESIIEVENLHKEIESTFNTQKRQIMIDMDQRLADKQKKMEKEIKKTKEQIVKEIEPVLYKTSANMVKKITGREIDIKDIASYGLEGK